jgi:Flp pilus assembly protein TadG
VSGPRKTGTTSRQPIRTDRGSVGLYMALLATGMLMMAGLVIDGGAAIATRQKAASLAEQAARAGADALSPASLRGAEPGQLVADPVAAAAAARRILAVGGATGTVAVNGGTVTVTAHVPRRAMVLSAVGVSDISQSATASATVLHGVHTAGG